MTGQTSGEIPALTGARFIAVLAVVIAHYVGVGPVAGAVQFENSRLAAFIGLPFAIFGMSLFFVLSGFVIYLNYSAIFRVGNRRSALRTFAVARFARIVPLYAILLLVTVAILPWQSVGAHMPKALLYVVLLQSWIPANGPSILAWSVPYLHHAWSISAEMFFYICFPAIAVALLAIRRPNAALLFFPLAYAALALLYCARQSILPAIAGSLDANDALIWLGYLAPYTRILEFIGGCIAARWFMQRRDHPAGPGERRMANAAAVLSVTCLVAMLAIAASRRNYFVIDRFWLFIGASFAGGPFMAWLLVYIARYESGLQRMLSRPAIVRGGEMSYSIYMFHLLVLMPFMSDARLPVGWWSVGEWMLRIAAPLLLLLVLSRLTYAAIEWPARKWIRQRLAPSIRQGR